VAPPPGTLDHDEVAAGKRLTEALGPHFDYLDGMLNLAAKLESFFDGRLFNTLSKRDLACLLMLGRITNDQRAILHLCLRGYGVQACTIAASIFELGWQVTLLAADETEADRWLRAERITDPGPGWERAAIRYIRAAGHPEPDKQLATERAAYARLCAMKHGNPAGLDLRPTDQWASAGTLRMGPDDTELGQKTICLAVELGGQVAELAMSEIAKKLLSVSGQQEFTPLLDKLTAQRLAVNATSKSRWTSFP